VNDAPDIRRRSFLTRAFGAVLGGAWLSRVAVRDAGAATQDELPFVGEIRLFGGDFAPVGWQLCNGQLLPIAGDYETLYQLIGTTYGGDGVTNFALPDLRGRVPLHVGTGYTLGQTSGVETVTLATTQIPSHNHVPQASSSVGNSDAPAGRIPARNAAGAPHYGGAIDTTLASGAVQAAGGSQPHENMQPWLGINFIISIYGVFPSQT
jgi:microcystin-dependent protein